MSAVPGNEGRIGQLILGIDATLPHAALKRDPLFKACVGASHRKQFFVPSGTALARRGNSLFSFVQTRRLALNNNPGKEAWQALCLGNRAMSLEQILRLDAVLQRIAAHPDEEVRDVTMVQQVQFELSIDAVVPSIWFASPSEFQAARIEIQQSDEYLPSKRQSLSRKIFGNSYTLDLIERGEDGKFPRVTKAFVDKLDESLGAGMSQAFSFAPNIGPRNGEGTVALKVSEGNVVG